MLHSFFFRYHRTIDIVKPDCKPSRNVSACIQEFSLPVMGLPVMQGFKVWVFKSWSLLSSAACQKSIKLHNHFIFFQLHGLSMTLALVHKAYNLSLREERTDQFKVYFIVWTSVKGNNACLSIFVILTMKIQIRFLTSIIAFAWYWGTY